MAFTSVTLIGTVEMQPGTAIAGAIITVTLSHLIYDGVTEITPIAQTATTDSSGHFSITVPANDDTTTLPLGTFYYVVITKANGSALDSFTAIVPHSGAPTFDLFSLARLETPPAQSTPYVVSINGQSGVVDLDETPIKTMVQVSGTQFVLDGVPVTFTGFNLPYQMVKQSTEPLATALSNWGPGPKLCRMFCFQTFNIVSGAVDFTLLDSLLATFQAFGVRVLLVLGNNVNAAGHANDDGALKDLVWYQGGTSNGYDQKIQSTSVPAQVMTYRNFVSAVATHLIGNPTVFGLQLVNEAQAINDDGTGSESAAFTAMNAFATDVGGLIKAIDPNRLVCLGNIPGFNGGPAGQQWTGSQTFTLPPTAPTTTNSDYQLLLSNANLDFGDYHNYGFPLNPLGLANATIGLAAACLIGDTVNKPIIVGESGIDWTSGATINTPISPATTAERALLVFAQLQAMFAQGVSAVLEWAWRTHPQVSDGSDYGMEIGPVSGVADPVMAYLFPGYYPIDPVISHAIGTTLTATLTTSIALTVDSAVHTLLTSPILSIGTWLVLDTVACELTSTTIGQIGFDLALGSGTAGTISSPPGGILCAFSNANQQTTVVQQSAMAVVKVTTVGTIIMRYESTSTGSTYNAIAGNGPFGEKSTGITCLKIA